MATHAYLPALIFLPQHTLHTIPKGYRPLFSNFESRSELKRLSSVNSEPRSSGQWNSTNRLFNNDPIVTIDPCIKRPILIDVQDTGPNSISFGSGIANRCTRRWELLKFLMSISNNIEGDEQALLKFSELVGFQETTRDMPREPYYPEHGLYFSDAESQPTLFYPNSDFYTNKPIVDFMGELALRNKLMVHPDGRVLVTGLGTEMKDVLSVIAKLYMLENKTKWEKKSVVVPYFDRYIYIC